ncbi:MAG: class I SAM-dependent methyltransferase [Candidatus Aureabacteria bacterium]|nr:class I SAM-dependent methyltransferase [Candidatus Auribacterota bacterium]
MDLIQKLKKDNSYYLIDSGGFQKLELIGDHLIVRPSPQAVWFPYHDSELWDQKEAWFIRKETGGGDWHFKGSSVRKERVITYHHFVWKVKYTPFGHIGLFGEHLPQMKWVEQQITTAGFQMEILNLFAYTGLATLTASRAGAKVCHLDAAKGIVDWARENAVLSGMKTRPIRWIVDDVFHFIKHEVKRGKNYDAIILDPPSFGRGPRKELWKIEDHLVDLLSYLRQLMSARFQFLLLSSHTACYSPFALKNLLENFCPENGVLEYDEMLIPQTGSVRSLPSGAFARWSRKNN